MKLRLPLLLFASGHFCVDLYSSMLGAFLPFLHDRLNLTLSQAGLLAGTLVFSSSLMQPVYGLLADRLKTRAFVVLGPAVAAIFISSLGLASGFRPLLLLLVLGGIGVAAFHPQAAALTHESSRDHHAFSMSFFVTAGTIGFALGPIFLTGVIKLFGVGGSFWCAVPGIVVSLLLLWYAPSPCREGAHDRPPVRRQLQGLLRPIGVLYVLVVIRSITGSGFASFLPLFYTSLGYTPARASQFLTLFLLAGGLAGLAGGILADRFGGKRITAISFACSLPLFLGFLGTTGFSSVLLSAAASAFLLFTGPVNIVMAQRLMPRGASTIAALMMGFAWGTAGLLIPLVGLMSEHFGFRLTFLGLSLLALPGFLLTLTLPRDDQTRGPLALSPSAETVAR